MKILVTGAKGFIGQNLVATLKNIKEGKDASYGDLRDITLYEYESSSTDKELEEYCRDCDFVYNFAGVNRPQKDEEFMEGNCAFIEKLISLLKKNDNKSPIVFSSSIQALQDNLYGRSKKAGEDVVLKYGSENNIPVYVYRFPNVFGKWCRPNYNSAVATFCYNIANGKPITVNDRDTILNLVYVDDLVDEMILVLKKTPHIDDKGYCYVSVSHTHTLGEIVDLLYAFHDTGNHKMLPDVMAGSFSKKLYSTYLSYLPTDRFSYPLDMHIDNRGSFTELFKTENHGQISVNISKPGIVKGEHWHHTKVEKFVVVKGEALIQFRKVNSAEVFEYHVTGKRIEVIDIPVGYTHNIINEGTEDLVTVMWCNECFNADKSDTYSLKVEEN